VLGVSVQCLALRVGQILGGRAGQAHAAVKPRQHPAVGQALHVAPDGLQGHAQLVRQRLDLHRAATAHDFEQLDLTGVEVFHPCNCNRNQNEQILG